MDANIKGSRSRVPSRKVIQFALGHNGEIVALCDDGTLWMGHIPSGLAPGKDGQWGRIASVPQPSDEPKPFKW